MPSSRSFNFGCELLVLGGQVLLEHVRRLDDVVVDAHQDQVVHVHARSPRTGRRPAALFAMIADTILRGSGMSRPTTTPRATEVTHDRSDRRDVRAQDAHRRQARRRRVRQTFDNVNPATEEVLGEVADASAADMHRAIDAARRAFDETDWSTDRAFRKRCLLQLQEALEGEQEELREELILEVGLPPHGHARPAARRAAGRRAALPGEADRRVPVGDRPRRRRRRAHRADHHRAWSWREPAGVVGAIVPVELPVRGDDQQARPGARHRQHGGAQAGARHAVQRHPPRPPRRRADRHPAGRASTS